MQPPQPSEPVPAPTRKRSAARVATAWILGSLVVLGATTAVGLVMHAKQPVSIHLVSPGDAPLVVSIDGAPGFVLAPRSYTIVSVPPGRRSFVVEDPATRRKAERSYEIPRVEGKVLVPLVDDQCFVLVDLTGSYVPKDPDQLAGMLDALDIVSGRGAPKPPQGRAPVAEARSQPRQPFVVPIDTIVLLQDVPHSVQAGRKVRAVDQLSCSGKNPDDPTWGAVQP